MGDYVYGSGEVTLKKELSAVNFSQIQEGLKKKKDDLDMVELTFRIRLDATNKSSIMEINEGSDSWDEENTLEILAYLAPYITEGRFVYFNEDEREYWRYVYVPLSEKWKRQEGQITYEKGIETRGHGKIILKEENTPGDRFNIQCDIEDAIQELNINITFYSDRCRGEDIIYLYEEEREIWNEEKTLKFLNLFNPYIKEGIIEYYGDKYPWNYQFNSATATWKKQDGWIIPSSETQIKSMSKDNHEQIFTIEDVLSVTGGNTKVKLVGYEGEIEHCVWTGIVDDYNFEYAPYGHHKAIHISVTNKDISQADNDVLYIYFNYPELTEENKKEIEELKKYFYFCDFPEGGVEQIYNSYIHGRHQMRLEAIVLIASALHVSVDYLLGLNEKEEVASQQYLNVWALSKNLKEILNNREQSKEKFAKEIKIATSTLYQILKGNRLPSIDTFCRIVRVSNVSADTLLNKDKGGIAA